MKAKQRLSKLRFNVGHLLDGQLGGRREVELDYPTIQLSDDVTLSPLQGHFLATRTSKGLYLQGDLHSVIEADCTRCLNSVALPISLRLDELFYHPPSAAPEGEYVIDEDGILDLAPLMRELSLLEVPMQVYCLEACRGICVQCGQNLNDADCDCEIDDIDPRMAVLRTLLNDE